MLAEARIGYRHHPELAPTTELRRLQYAEDDRHGVGKRNRAELAPEYARRYLTEILDRVDLGAFAFGLPEGNATALMCVERDPPASHRSLIAGRLAAEHGARIEHLLPLPGTDVRTESAWIEPSSKRGLTAARTSRCWSIRERPSNWLALTTARR